MRVPGYCTKDNPGQIQLWLYSLGVQKDAILQWPGKDELVKHKTLEPAVKYIRTKVMVDSVVKHVKTLMPSSHLFATKI